MSEQATSKAPQIRFKGFTGAWEEDQLGERVEFFSGLTYSPRNVQKGVGTLVLRSSNVKNGEIVDADNVYVDSSIVNSKNVEVGDIAVVVRNGSRSLIGKHAPIKQRMDRTVIGAFMTGIHSEVPAFTNALLDTPQFDKEIAKNLGATINQITTGSFKQMMFRFPLDAEQEQVGEYFRELDNLIGLHQRKHDKLVTLKKAMLQKMFPKPGVTTPEIRFKGFSGGWVESRLGLVAEITTGFPFKSEDFNDSGEYLVITNGNIQNELTFVDASIGNRINIRNSTGLSQFILRIGDILVTMDGSVGRTAKVNEKNQILAQRVGRLAAKSDSEFLYQALNTGAFLEAMTVISHGGTIKHISLDEIGGYSFFLPSDSEEQQKIGSYFRTLDTLIAKNATQLQKLQQIKSACLEKMFV